MVHRPSAAAAAARFLPVVYLIYGQRVSGGGSRKGGTMEKGQAVVWVAAAAAEEGIPRAGRRRPRLRRN